MIRRLRPKLTDIGPKLRRVLGLPDPDFPRPPLEDNEYVIREGPAVFLMGLFGGRAGRILLTNRRFHWYETSNATWPFKRITDQVSLSDILSADKGTPLDLLGGGTRLRLRLRDGRDKCMWEANGRLNEWLLSIRGALTDTEQPDSGQRRRARRAVIRILSWIVTGAIAFGILFRELEAIPIGMVFGGLAGVAAYFPRSHPASLLALVFGGALAVFFVAPAF